MTRQLGQRRHTPKAHSLRSDTSARQMKYAKLGSKHSGSFDAKILSPLIFFAFFSCFDAPLAAQDMKGATDQPLVTRFPGTNPSRQTIEIHRSHRLPAGPVTDHRTIDDWIDTEGHTTSSFSATLAPKVTMPRSISIFLGRLRSKALNFWATAFPMTAKDPVLAPPNAWTSL